MIDILPLPDVTPAGMVSDDDSDDDMPPPCTICLQVAHDELQCYRCKSSLHYICCMGFDPPEELKTSEDKSKFLCATCLVGSDLELLHRALDTHSKSRGSAHLSPTQGDNRHNHQDELSVSHLSPIQGVNRHNHLDESSDTTIHPGQPVHPGEGGVTPPHVHEGSQGDAHTSQPSAQTSSSDHIASATPSPDDADFRHVVSDHERRRIKRCKGMIYGLKHVSRTVDTLLILDSNGRSISSEDIDGNGEAVCVKQIGGLCVSATASALKECKVRYPNIKLVGVGLGTNDHLHAREHPGEKADYFKNLDKEMKKVFPNAKVSFILPFASIDGLGVDYVHSIARAIITAGVKWKIHQTPSMKGKLVSPRSIHLNPVGRVSFTLWLRKVFAPNRSSPSSTPVTSQSASGHTPGPSRGPSLIPSSAPSSARNNADLRSYSSVASRNGGNERDSPPPPQRFENPVSNKYGSLDQFLRDRLCELLLGSETSRSHSPNGPRWYY